MSSETAGACLSDRRLITAYEDLRSHAIRGRHQGPGLALIMARGLRCWAEACSQLLHTETNRTPEPHPPEFRLPSGVREEIVVLLASMLLHRTPKRIV